MLNNGTSMSRNHRLSVAIVVSHLSIAMTVAAATAVELRPTINAHSVQVNPKSNPQINSNQVVRAPFIANGIGPAEPSKQPQNKASSDARPAASQPASVNPRQPVKGPGITAPMTTGTTSSPKSDDGNEPTDKVSALKRQTLTGFVYVIDQDIKSLINDYARRMGLRAQVSAGVRGRVTGKRIPLDPDSFFRSLIEFSDVDWYIEGDTLNVFGRGETTSRIMELQTIDYETLKRELTSAGLDSGRMQLRLLNNANSVMVTAPPGYLGRVAAILDALKDGHTRNSGLRFIRYGFERSGEVKPSKN